MVWLIFSVFRYNVNNEWSAQLFQQCAFGSILCRTVLTCVFLLYRTQCFISSQVWLPGILITTYCTFCLLYWQCAKRAAGLWLFCLTELLGSHTVRALCFNRRICHLSVPHQKNLSEIGAEIRHIYRKSGSPSKNMMLDFAPEVAKYLK